MHELVGAIQRIFSYDPETGVLIRRVSFNRATKPGPTGTVKSNRKGANRYVQVNVHYNGRNRCMHGHIVAYILMTGEFPPSDLDHKNGDGLDNRWENLRLATPSENGMNRGPNRNKKSGLPKGVRWHSRDRLYVAELAGKYVKSSKSLEAAKSAYDSAARERFGEFAKS